MSLLAVGNLPNNCSKTLHLLLTFLDKPKLHQLKTTPVFEMAINYWSFKFELMGIPWGQLLALNHSLNIAHVEFIHQSKEFPTFSRRRYRPARELHNSARITWTPVTTIVKTSVARFSGQLERYCFVYITTASSGIKNQTVNRRDATSIVHSVTRSRKKIYRDKLVVDLKTGGQQHNNWVIPIHYRS